jgi:hypothetical protein
MSARSIFLRVGSVADRLAEPVGWLGAAVAFLILLYLLAAPPVVLAHVRQTGSGAFPPLYGLVFQRRLGRGANADRRQRRAAMVHHSYLHRPWRGIDWRPSPTLFQSVA